MKSLFLMIPLLLLLAGCEKKESVGVDGPSLIFAVGCNPVEETSENSGWFDTDEDIVFSGDDIEWFNAETREIKFKEAFSPYSIPMYKEIRFELSGEVLFSAMTFATDINSQIFNDLVLYYSMQRKKYYLNDSYPAHIFTEQARINKENRAVAWARFLEQLKAEGKLRGK